MTPFAEPAIRPMTETEFDRFKTLIYEEAGIHLGPGKKDLLAGRLTRRMRELGIRTFREYYHRLLHRDGTERVHWGTGRQQGKMKAGPEIRSMVRFGRVNLNDEAYPLAGPFDVIFCRNVLIYFDVDSKMRVLHRLLNYLAPDGYLFLGQVESVHGLTDQLRAVGPTVYSPATDQPTLGAIESETPQGTRTAGWPEATASGDDA